MCLCDCSGALIADVIFHVDFRLPYFGRPTESQSHAGSDFTIKLETSEMYSNWLKYSLNMTQLNQLSSASVLVSCWDVCRTYCMFTLFIMERISHKTAWAWSRAVLNKVCISRDLFVVAMQWKPMISRCIRMSELCRKSFHCREMVSIFIITGVIKC